MKAQSSQKKKAAATQAVPVEEPTAGTQYWLLKSEPDEYPLEALRDEPNGQGFWDGVRNPVARNNMQKMNVGDLCFFYHSSCKVPACVGICEVAVEAHVDKTALDSKHKYFDPKSDPAKVCLSDASSRQPCSMTRCSLSLCSWFGLVCAVIRSLDVA